MKPFNLPPLVFSVVLLAALLAPRANAQVADQNLSGEIHFRTLGWGVGQSGLFYITGGEYKALSLSKSSLSGYHPYSGSRQIQVFRKVTDEATGTDSYLSFAESTLLAGASEQILVFFQSPTDQNLIRIYAYDDSIESLGEQSVFIGNFSPLDLAFQVNEEERFGLKPGQSRIIKHNGGRNASVQIAAYRGDEWTVEYRASPRLRTGFRYYFFFRDMKGKSEFINGIDPIIYKESVLLSQMALKSPDGEEETGDIGGGTVPFDPSVFE
jgi:hypothetical protein